MTVLLAGSSSTSIGLTHIYINLGTSTYPNQRIDIPAFHISKGPDGKNSPVDVNLTPFVYESERYNSLLDDEWDKDTDNRNNVLYYERNDNKIYMGDTKSQYDFTGDILKYVLTRAVAYQIGLSLDETDGIGYTQDLINVNYQQSQKYKYCFNCEYYPVLDGKVAQESTANKNEKETVVSQSGGNIELNRLGNNLQGLIAKLGNEEKSITVPITKFKNKIQLGTKYVDELNNVWFANKIQTTFTTNEERVIVNVTFTKNYNAMAQFTSLDKEKRFYQIDRKIVNKGYENLNEYVYFSSYWIADPEFETPVGWNEDEQIAFNHYGLEIILRKTLGDAIFDSWGSGYNTVFDNVAIYTYGNETIGTYIVPTVYGCGNQICFEMGYDDPVGTVRRTRNAGQTSQQTLSMLYTNKSGISDKITIRASVTQNTIWDLGTLQIYDLYPSTGGYVPTGQPIFSIEDYYYYKKPNEIFHVNYALNFLPWFWKKTDALGTPQYKYEQIFFGDKFINENGIIPNTAFEKGAAKKLYLYASKTEKYSIIDNEALGDRIEGTTTIHVNTSTSNSNGVHGAIYVLIDGDNFDLSSYKSWCIADENRKMYIAVNRDICSYPYPQIDFWTCRFRKT